MNAVGVPPGVYNVVHGLGPNSAGEFLTAASTVLPPSPSPVKPAPAQAILKSAASMGHSADVSFELGGKNAAVVFADC